MNIRSVKRAILNQGPPCPPGDIWQCLGTDSIVTIIAIFTTLYVAFWCSRKKSFESVTMGQNSGIHFQCFKIFVKKMCITPNYIDREMGNRAGKPCSCSIHTVKVTNIYKSQYIVTCLTHLHDNIWPFLPKDPKQKRERERNGRREGGRAGKNWSLEKV